MNIQSTTVSKDSDSLLQSLAVIDDEAIASKRRVFIAATIVSNRNERVTQKAVRALLGGGSFGPIGDYINEWREERKEEKELIDTPIPLAIEDKFDLAKASVWQAAQDEAEKKLVIERESLDKAQKQAALAVQDSQDAIKVLEEEAVLQAGLVAERDELIADLEKIIEQKDGDLKVANDAIKELEIKSADKEKIEKELKYVKEEGKALIDNKFKLSSDLKESEMKLKSSLAKVDDLHVTIDELNDKNKEISAEHKTVVDILQEENKEAETEIKALEKSNNSLDMQVHKHQHSLDSAVAKASDLKSEVKELRKDLGDRDRETGSLAGELKAVSEQNKQLNSRVTDLEKSLVDLNK